MVASPGSAAVRIVVRGPAAAGGLRVVQELAALVDGDAGAQVVSALHHPPAPRAGDGPALVVADPVHAIRPAAGQLVVVLAREDYVPPDDAELIDLQPLAPDEARAVIGAHVRPADASRASAEILAVTTAWPADLEEAAARWSRDAAAATVRDASAVVSRTADQLSRARRQLSDGVLALVPEAAAGGPTAEVCPWRGLSAYDSGMCSGSPGGSGWWPN